MGALAIQGWEWELLRIVLPSPEGVQDWKSGKGGAALSAHSPVLLLLHSFFSAAVNSFYHVFCLSFPTVFDSFV